MENTELEMPSIGYKINVEHNYKVYVTEYGGKKYYKIPVTKKNYDKTETTYYKQVRFAKCTPPEDGDVIRIKKGFEDLYTNNKDPYNPISVIVILDYDSVENLEQIKEKALDKFQQILNENEEEVIDEDLPF